MRGEEKKLVWRAMECWAALVQARGEVVTREQLHQRIWGDALMEESNLANTVATLRKAVDPAPDGKSYVETVPRLGYRLAVAVQAAEPQSYSIEEPPKRYPWVWAGAGFVVVVLLALIGERFMRRCAPDREAERLARAAMTSMRLGNMKAYAQARTHLDAASVIQAELPLVRAAAAELAARAGEESFSHALELARNASERDPKCSECLGVLGFIEMTRFWNWKVSGQLLEKASALPDASAQTHLWRGQWLGIQSQPDEALKELEKASRMDASKISAWVMKGVVRYLSGDYEGAKQELAKAESLDPWAPQSYYWRYRCFLIQGQTLEAALQRAKHYSLYAGFSADRESEIRNMTHKLYEQGGKEALLAQWLDETKGGQAQQQHRYERALWRMWEKDREGAIEELLEAEKSRPFNLIYVGADPIFKSLRGDARFDGLLKRLGLPPVSR